MKNCLSMILKLSVQGSNIHMSMIPMVDLTIHGFNRKLLKILQTIQASKRITSIFRGPAILYSESQAKIDVIRRVIAPIHLSGQS